MALGADSVAPRHRADDMWKFPSAATLAVVWQWVPARVPGDGGGDGWRKLPTLLSSAF
jgi:hypothetical protein